MTTSRGGGAAAFTYVALIAPLEFRNISRYPVALYAPALNNSAHSFSESSSCLLLFISFLATRKDSHLAIAVATAFRKSLVAVTIYETYSIDLRKPTSKPVLRDRVTLATTFLRILIILAVAS